MDTEDKGVHGQQQPEVIEEEVVRSHSYRACWSVTLSTDKFVIYGTWMKPMLFKKEKKDFLKIIEDVICLQEMHIKRKDTKHLIHKILGEEFYQKVNLR